MKITIDTVALGAATPDTIKALASGGIVVDTGVPITPSAPNYATSQFDPQKQIYSVDGNPAIGDNQLAGQIAANHYAGTPCEISVLQASGAPIRVDARVQLEGKRVQCFILTKPGNDIQATIAAVATIAELFGGSNVSVTGAIGYNAGGVAPGTPIDELGRTVPVAFDCK